jgi:hypothetical protein
VSEEVEGATRARVDCSPEETKLVKDLEEYLRRKLGLEKLTVKNLQLACRDRNIPHTGKKLKILQTLGFFFKEQENNPAAARPLATDYIRDDQDLSDSDAEDGNDEEIEET